MTVVSMSYLLEAGVHFGHQTKRWNPKMKEYIYNSRDDIYIIDLQKTVAKMEEAYEALNKIAAEGGKVLYVGTKKQAQEVCKEEAERSNMYYMTERWLGGTLTNFKTIRRRVNRLEEIEKMEKDGTFDRLPKKEVVGLKKEYEKLNKNLCGIREMTKLPQAIIIVDSTKEYNAIREAKKLGIPVFGLIDTNCDPDDVDYVLPGNDDAVRSIKVVLGSLTNAIIEANGGTIIDYVSEDDKKPVKEKTFAKKDKKEVKETKEVTEKEEIKEEKPELDLNILTVAELRDLAKKKEIKGYSKMKKEELELISNKDIAAMILEDSKRNLNTAELFKKIIKLLELPESTFEAKIADFYTALATDKRFILLDNGKWDLRSNHTSDKVVKLSTDDDDDDEDEETEEDKIEDIQDNEDNYDDTDDDSDYDDDTNEELKDLVVIDEDELELEQ